jgi:hypothetical protein
MCGNDVPRDWVGVIRYGQRKSKQIRDLQMYVM